MTFDEWFNEHRKNTTFFNACVCEHIAESAWNAAIEHAAMMVGKRGAEPGEMQPESIAREIRMMRSNL